jgi:hypothetical protein
MLSIGGTSLRRQASLAAPPLASAAPEPEPAALPPPAVAAVSPPEPELPALPQPAVAAVVSPPEPEPVVSLPIPDEEKLVTMRDGIRAMKKIDREKFPWMPISGIAAALAGIFAIARIKKLKKGAKELL